MIFLIFGDDTYRAQKVLRDFERRFENEVPHAWQKIDCEAEDIEETIARLGAGSLFAAKDFIVVQQVSVLRGALAEKMEALFSRWEKDDSVAVLYERGVPEKNELFESMKERATKKQEFGAPTAAVAARFLADELKKRGAAITSAQKDFLLREFGVDLARLEGELEKIILGGEMREARIAMRDQDIFLVGDLWGRREMGKAVVLYHKLLRAGFGADNILRTLMWHVKNLFLVREGRAKGLNPFVEKKAREQARNFEAESLREAYESLLMLDVNEKRGQGSIEFGLLHFLLTR